MNYIEMQNAIDDAENTLRLADSATTKTAKMLVGRLRKVTDSYQGRKTLSKLKKELSQYNARTGEWKN